VKENVVSQQAYDDSVTASASAAAALASAKATLTTEQLDLGYTTLRAGVDARERVRLLWRPDPVLPGVVLLHNTVFALYHRDVFALDAQTGAVRWAYVSPQDLAGVAVVRAGLVVIDDHGVASLLAPTRSRPSSGIRQRSEP
jgi:hypothetical protein